MKGIALAAGVVAVLVALIAVRAWQQMRAGYRKEFAHFNVDFPTNLTQHLTNIGETDYIAVNENRYALAEIQSMNANPEIMAGLKANLPGAYYSIRHLCSWRSRFCRVES